MCNSAAYNRSSISLVGVSFTCFIDHRLAGQQAHPGPPDGAGQVVSISEPGELR
jgi:hypothetical protein